VRIFEITAPVTGTVNAAPGSQPKPPAGAMTTTAVRPVSPAANVSIGGTSITDPNKFRQDIIQKVKTDSKAAEQFADLLATLLKVK